MVYEDSYILNEKIGKYLFHDSVSFFKLRDVNVVDVVDDQPIILNLNTHV